MLESLACLLVEAILERGEGGGRGAFNRHGVFIRGWRLIQIFFVHGGRLLDTRRLFESGRLLDHLRYLLFRLADHDLDVCPDPGCSQHIPTIQKDSSQCSGVTISQHTVCDSHYASLSRFPKHRNRKHRLLSVGDSHYTTRRSLVCLQSGWILQKEIQVFMSKAVSKATDLRINGGDGH